MNGPDGPAFLPLAASRRGIRLRCLRAHDPAVAGGTLHAYCRGIAVGRHAIAAPLAAGAEFDLPIDRLPRVELPAELRFAAAPEGPDLAPPWPLPHATAALALLGPPPPPAIEGLRLDHGVLHGVALLPTHGLIEPVMYARLNEAGARGVTTQAPWPLPEGGCAFRFALALDPGDLQESGLAVTLHLVGLEAPVARFAWARAGADDPGPRLAALEARLAALDDTVARMGLAVQEEARRHAAHLAERTDAFIETAAALLLDRLAVADRPGPGDGAAADGPAAAGGADAARLRALIAEAAAAAPATEPLRLAMRAELPPAAGHLAIGWHQPESDANGPFRWMGDSALVVNPEPHRAVAGVTLRVLYVYGAAAPDLSGAFDGAPARVTVAEAAGRFTVRLEPAGGAAVACRGLTLTAAHAGVPLRDGRNPDPRLLSLAVAGVVFDYAP